MTKVGRSIAECGNARLGVEMVFGESTVTSSFATSPMKLLTPVSRGKSVWAYTSSFGGGLVAGDQTRLEISLGAGSRCFVGTQSSTKIYRNPAGHPCSHNTNAVLGPGSLLIFAPEPVQAFADSHYTQRQEFRLGAGAGLLLLDWFTSGRAARGERWAFAHLESRNEVFVENERVLLDPILLTSPEVAEHMGRFNCMASLLLLGAPFAEAAEAMQQALAARAVERRAAQSFSVSPVRGGVLMRIAGIEVENVRRELQNHLWFVGELLGDDPWARKS